MKEKIEMMHVQAKEYQGLPANHWKLEERHETDFLIQPSEEPAVLINLFFGLLAFRS